MIKSSRFYYVVCFLIIAFSFIGYQRTHKLRVFVLYSYHKQMPWVQGLQAGIDQVFAKRHYVDFRYFYMDTKRKHSQSYLSRTAREAKLAIDHYQPDVLIVFDYNAQKWVASNFIKQKTFPVLVSGVTADQDLVAYQRTKNVAGVIEKTQVRAIQEVISLMFPKAKKLYYLSDNSPSAQQLEVDVSKSDWGKFALVEHAKVDSVSEWKQHILKAQQQADVILVSTYQTIRDKKRFPTPEKLIEWTLSHSRIPVIGLYESFVIDGGYLAISVASFEQGYTAAKLALFLIEKKITIDQIPFITNQTFQLQMRKHQALKHYPDIQIPVILDALSKTKWQLDDIFNQTIPLSMHPSSRKQNREDEIVKVST